MKIIIVDTNIIFSSILNPKSNIGDILFNHNEKFEFFAPEYLREEIDRHRNRIVEISKTTESDVNQAIFQVYKQIQFIADQQIPFEFWATSVPFVRDVDMDDLPFVALTFYLDGFLWTGDKVLLNGLISKGFNKFFTTQKIIELINEK